MRTRHQFDPRNSNGRGPGRPAFGEFGPPGFGGPGPFGPGPFGPWGHKGRGGRGRPGGRARRGDVRASLLALLKERPMHGYEMIREIAERSGGSWRPSPGSVYPTLQMLDEEGLITSAEDGGKKLFSLTEAGRAEAEQGPDAPWEEAEQGEHWEVVREFGRAGGAVKDALRQVVMTGTPEQRAKALAVLADTRKRLYLILADADSEPAPTDASPEDRG
ncbi:PadR family transcriptional regulator [Streptacidiphilus jiangxiensis]|uniref:Transcriptional regulator PadR-like family protein n=1 Tax=Streptacidiphilus jiangxiensis TaxID=235985 RepID=A0A1H7Y7C3_STRJI|nr:PadR family transcriptional regulator [Streptacidiphilus jiangxiensis]SEM41811.1 Transcriptional regulator PadR-like family protein [Streptacidiphilus jiangxiensis]